ncbi:S-adenosyl-L-methionine-dependent methyltransferase [Clohesyomyces aquaticus]|uniref:S-adenosyl-L-methionine-dependent methyltransferase n=1 Tax=Clohesyomyces aquaticus TaxID=1231657 RepID=A0A1Y1ZXP7_9PLEO|nr:S-adenosyl-L-methionine-dependent methyltransferase [Clohesyomyces aquaticus]
MSPPAPPSEPETKPSEPDPKRDSWSPQQYLRFDNERTRPVHDLISQIIPLLNPPLSSSQTADRGDRPLRIYDLGCGPGNSTRALLSHFPSARVTGIDSSSAMLAKARQDFTGTNTVDFALGDVSTFTPDSPPDLLFSNAVFHWLRTPTRLPTLTRLLSALPPGGVLAFQVPDNYHEPSHSLMRSTALLPHQPWSPYFASSSIGNLISPTRPDLDPIEPPSLIYSSLIPYCSSVNVWRTEYFHVLGGKREIVEWVKGTGLVPFLERLPEKGGVREAFLKRYEDEVGKVYEEAADGRCLLGYPRLFVVAVRK